MTQPNEQTNSEVEVEVSAESAQAPEGDRHAMIAGRYRVKEELGRGGQGETYLAWDLERECHVAIKAFDLKKSEDWKEFELFERECRVLGELHHLAVPELYEAFEGESGTTFYLVMEYIPGKSLSADFEEGAVLDEAGLWDVLWRTLDVLAYLHGRNPPVVHRDIKPANLIRRPDGHIALVDFGGVRDFLRAGGGSTVVGTFGYMAPEQLGGQAMPATDIYALGATLVALATGMEPEKIKRKGLKMDLKAHLKLSKPMMKLLRRMLAPDPDDRPESAIALRAELLDQVGQTRPAETPEQPVREADPEPVQAAAVEETLPYLFPVGTPGPIRVLGGAATVGIGVIATVVLVFFHFVVLPALFFAMNAIASDGEKRRLGERKAMTRGVVSRARRGAHRLTAIGNREIRDSHRRRPRLRGPRRRG